MIEVLQRTAPDFVVGPTPPPNPELYRKLLRPITDTGNPEYNPLLVGSMEISDHAREMCQQYGFEPYFEPAFQLALNGRAAEGFMNVVDHQVKVARFTQAQMRLIGRPFEEEVSIMAAALMHDCDTPMHKLEHPHSKTESNGVVQCEIDPRTLFHSEMFDHPLDDVPDIDAFDPYVVHQVRVTHLDWRDSDRWTSAELALRAADSSVMNDQIVPWWIRVGDLAHKKPHLHEAGKDYYNGQGAFDRLGWLTFRAFTELEESAEKVNQEYLTAHGYPKHSVREICVMMAEGVIEMPPANLCNLQQ